MMKNNKLAVILSRYAAVIALVLLLCGWISFRLVDNTVIHASNWNNKADSLLNDIVTDIPSQYHSTDYQPYCSSCWRE